MARNKINTVKMKAKAIQEANEKAAAKAAKAAAEVAARLAANSPTRPPEFARNKSSKDAQPETPQVVATPP